MPAKPSFQHALREIPVPQILVDGIPVLRVYANGVTREASLSLSSDKFTLFVKTEKLIQKRSFFRSPTKPQSSKNDDIDDTGFRGIDIGAISKIQRGHARHRRFDMARSRTDSIKSLMSSVSLENSVSASTVDELNPALCFSIIFRGDWTLDLMMSKTANISRDQILNALDHIINTYQNAKVQVSNDVLLLRYVWRDADKDKTGTAASSELQKILKRINYHVANSKKFNEAYDKFGRSIHLDKRMRRQGLTFEQTASFLHKLKRDSWMAKPLNQYWNRLFGEHMKNGKPRKDVSATTFLQKFLIDFQGESNATLQQVQKLFSHLNSLELPKTGDSYIIPKDPSSRIDKDRFEAYLNSEENDAFDPVKERYNDKSMSRPISEYWINSSHNTYLTGDQITSHSSVDMYSNALYRGCRCLELDVWDGEVVDDVPRPVVWHGHTMTSKIFFKDIIKAIKLFLNFHPDTFPLILSFENHCSIPYQEVMAEELVRVLGNSLYIPSEASLQGRLPSPMDLRGMVVIKGRRPSNLDLDAAEDYDDDNSEDGTAPSTTYTSEYGTTALAQAAAAAKNNRIHHKICASLARMTLFHGSRLRNWEESIRNQTHYMHSFSENKIRSLAKKSDRRTWTIYNQSHMSRSYPAGSRVDSSNYLPILPWSVGCQMVALNFQTNDVALKLNDGRFRENGACGYVLKSNNVMEMHLDNSTIGGRKGVKDGKRVRQSLKVSIRVLSGSCIPKANEDDKAGECINPYVKVSIYDVKNGYKEGFQTYSTGVCHNNGFAPIWNSDKFNFGVENQAVAMLHLVIYDKAGSPTVSDAFVASASIPISCLRKGLRSVKLFDTSNTRSGAIDFATLLIEVKQSKGDTITYNDDDVDDGDKYMRSKRSRVQEAAISNMDDFLRVESIRASEAAAMATFYEEHEDVMAEF